MGEDPILELGRNWAYALNNPLMLANLQAMVCMWMFLI